MNSNIIFILSKTHFWFLGINGKKSIIYLNKYFVDDK